MAVMNTGRPPAGFRIASVDVAGVEADGVNFSAYVTRGASPPIGLLGTIR